MTDTIRYREATLPDVPALAKLCAQHREDEGYWRARIEGYMMREFNPHQAKTERLVYVAVHKDVIVGFIAGHLTKRNDYPGQIQWISVAEQCKRMGIGSELLWILAGWFCENNAIGVRTDIDPENTSLQDFYRHHYASSINKYWLYWDDVRLLLNDREPSGSQAGAGLNDV